MTGFEPLAAAATAGLTALVTDIIKGQGSNAITRFFNQDIGKAAQQAYFDASKKYIENYAERHCSLKVLGMREPVSLDSVYTTVQVLDGEDRSFASVEELERAFREAQERRFRFTEDSKKDGLQIAIAKSYLMVLGAPGSGKSTFLRKMGLEALKGRQGGFKNHRCIPVLLELKRFTEAKIDLKKLITHEFQTCGFPNAERFSQKALEQGKLLILLDGLDEVPSVNRDNVTETIQDFVDQYDKNRYITSCRTAVSRRNLRRFTDVTIAEFDDDQIQQFINNWFQSEVDRESGTAKRCWKLLRQSENAAAKELAHTPLLLTFLCLVYDRSQTFSNNRSTLYRKALRILLEEWAAEKRIMREEIYQGLNTELEEVLLSEIASKSFDADRLFLSQGELVGQIKIFLASNLNVPMHLSGEKVLDAIAVQQGILVERAETVYSFSHLTLQEYLTAKYIVENCRIEPLVEHLSDRRWREVFLLVSGLMVSGNGADELLKTMNQSIQKYVAGISKLQALLQWTNQMAVPGAEGWKMIVNRADVLSFALDHSSGGDIARDLALTFSRGHASRTSMLFSVHDLARAIDNFDFDGFDFDGFDFNPDLSRARIRDLALALARARDYALTLTLTPSRDHVLARENATALALELARASALARDIGGNYLFVGLSGARLAQQLEMILSASPKTDAFREECQQFAEKLLNLYRNLFSLDSNLLNVTLEEQNAVDSYFYMNQLMVECRQEAIRVSPQAWETILSTMLLPASNECQSGNPGMGETGNGD